MTGQIQFIFTGLALTLLVTIINGAGISRFIVDGVNAQGGDYPWQLSFQRRSKRGTWHHVCGAVLVHARFAITASHCLYNIRKETLRVVAGTHRTRPLEPDTDIHALKRVVTPAGLSLGFDIALLELDVSANTSRADISPIAIANSGEPAVGTECTLTGWGLQSGSSRRTPSRLQEGRMVVVSMRKCEESGWLLFLTNLCARGRPRQISGCHGDSGSPLSCVRADGTPIVVGVFSRGYPNDCRDGRPNVFTRLSTFRPWLRRVTRMSDL